MIEFSRLENAYSVARDHLMEARHRQGHWEGQLSSSALSTATAVSALSIYLDKVDASNASAPENFSKEALRSLVEHGVAYLERQQNPDGGWGDTDLSYSNISTSTLVVAAFKLAAPHLSLNRNRPINRNRAVNRKSAGHDAVAENNVVAGLASSDSLIENAHRYLDKHAGPAKIRARYGKDKTFAVPILTNAALAGMVDWKEVEALPFEAATIPQKFYHLMQLPVVSYAIPALVAIGQAKFFKDPPRNPLTRALRRLSINRSLKVLLKMQPESGGYLEAIPLTCFVVMSLAATDRQHHAVTQQGIRFIVESVREDGSWPIDTNLATWNTTLSINALANAGDDVGKLNCWDWLLSCQYQDRHPFTGAEPGAWGWSNLSGAVPDADDTPGAMLALKHWLSAATPPPSAGKEQVSIALRQGRNWLANLQNRDGGWPTFCRGWGKLPFDRSGTDLTAHALRAMKGLPDIDNRSIERGFRFLEKNQRSDGCWVPLWFGNQDLRQLDNRDLSDKNADGQGNLTHATPKSSFPIDINDEENPVYGTAKVLLAYCDWERFDTQAAQDGLEWLLNRQNPDGGWGGGPSVVKLALQSDPGSQSSIEETALALEALAAWALHRTDQRLVKGLNRGVEFLVTAVEKGTHLQPWPIGFYFAKLWYYEKLYPLVFTVAALGRSLSWLRTHGRESIQDLPPREQVASVVDGNESPLEHQ